MIYGDSYHCAKVTSRWNPLCAKGHRHGTREFSLYPVHRPFLTHHCPSPYLYCANFFSWPGVQQFHRSSGQCPLATKPSTQSALSTTHLNRPLRHSGPCHQCYRDFQKISRASHISALSSQDTLSYARKPSVDLDEQGLLCKWICPKTWGRVKSWGKRRMRARLTWILGKHSRVHGR